MTIAFKAKSELKHGIFTMTLTGPINEHADFGSHANDFQQAFINFEGVKYINSSGVKRWIVWINDLVTSHKKLDLNFLNCSRVIVDQMNLIKGFKPPEAKIKSFYTPYFCDYCRASHEYLYRLGHEYEKHTGTGKIEFRHPSVSCPNCKQKMEPDFMPEKYFAFLNLKK